MRLARHTEDAEDPYLPLMLWYGVEPLVAADPDNAFKLLAECRIPLVREYLARRLVSLGKDGLLDRLVLHARDADAAPVQRDVLRGVQEGLSGRRRVPMPPNWTTAYPALAGSPLPEVRERAVALAVQFGDRRALQTLRDVVLDTKQGAVRRGGALETLIFQQSPDLVPVLHRLLDDPALRPQALRGLAAFEHPETARLILKGYPGWTADEKADAIHTLASRPAYALALLDAIQTGAVPRTDVGAFTVRQIGALKQPEVQAKLQAVWGAVRPPSEEKAALMSRYKSALTADVLKKSDLANGRRVYARTCAACHRLFGEGGEIGPELTGSQRHHLDYVLENVLDPSAVVPRDYQVSVFSTTTGRVVTGTVKKETDRAVVVQTQNEVVTLPRDEIDSRTPSPLSMMPEGLFAPMRMEEVRDLVAYLASPRQVPLGGGQ
jgi:putative heme-binding domain-containing protein